MFFYELTATDVIRRGRVDNDEVITIMANGATKSVDRASAGICWHLWIGTSTPNLKMEALYSSETYHPSYAASLHCRM